jgi:hypothetical protein
LNQNKVGRFLHAHFSPAKFSLKFSPNSKNFQPASLQYSHSMTQGITTTPIPTTNVSIELDGITYTRQGNVFVVAPTNPAVDFLHIRKLISFEGRLFNVIPASNVAVLHRTRSNERLPDDRSH